MNNCRSCKWANWARTASGRISPNGYSTCDYPMPEKMPAARLDLTRQMARRVSVARHGVNDAMDCHTFEKLPPKEKP